MRKAVIIPMEEFQKKVKEMKTKQEDDDEIYSSTIMKDLGKYFNWENYEDEESQWEKMMAMVVLWL